MKFLCEIQKNSLRNYKNLKGQKHLKYMLINRYLTSGLKKLKMCQCLDLAKN